MVKKLVALALALLAPAAGGGVKFSSDDLKSEEALWQLYERWGARYNVARDPVEKLRRFDTFKETAHRVASRVRAAGQAPGLNIFADMSDEEFNRGYKCRMTERRSLTRPVKIRRGGGTLPLPASFSWRDKSCKGGQPCLGPVKDQGGTAAPAGRLPRWQRWRAGADPAWGQGGLEPPYPHELHGRPPSPPRDFIHGRRRRRKKKGREEKGGGRKSCAPSIKILDPLLLESNHNIRGANNEKPVVELSEQELVDCDTTSDGCKGGLAVEAFGYVSKNGLASSASYPYRGTGGACQAKATPRVDLIVRGFEEVQPHDEFQMLSAVTFGPVVVSIAVGDDNREFTEYEGDGLYRGKCGTENDHELLLVGYGFDYYVLKNSYGEDWGDEGYLLLPRDRSCGMLDDGGSYPEMGI